MEIIHLPKLLESDYSDDTDSQIRSEHSDEMEAEFEKLHWNIKEVVISTHGIERNITSAIEYYFMPKERELFASLILQSDFFTFASALKTIKQIQEKENFLSPEE